MEHIAMDGGYVGISAMLAGAGLLGVTAAIMVLTAAAGRTQARWAVASLIILIGAGFLIGAGATYFSGTKQKDALPAAYAAKIEARYGIALTELQISDLGFPLEQPSTPMPLGETEVLEPVAGSSQSALKTIRLLWGGEIYTISAFDGVAWSECPLVASE